VVFDQQNKKSKNDCRASVLPLTQHDPPHPPNPPHPSLPRH
jgi:hypothetical protein